MSNRGQAWCEWPTWALIIAVTVSWALITAFADRIGLFVATLSLIPLIALHSSLQHETLHILEPRWPLLARVAVFPAIGLFIPYIRFRDLHLVHHHNEMLTDPYDDPETFYLEPTEWARYSRSAKQILIFNNTLFGRLIAGPLIGQLFFMRAELRKIQGNDPSVLKAWLWHVPAMAIVLAWLFIVATIPFWAYFAAAYLGLSVLKVRTFLEHRAHEDMNHRSVIIEKSGVLSFLFLNNNLHHVHHAHPTVPWYALPRLFYEQRQKFLTANGGYRYDSYLDVFRNHFFHAKESVPHPIWSIKNRTQK